MFILVVFKIILELNKQIESCRETRKMKANYSIIFLLIVFFLPLSTLAVVAQDAKAEKYYINNDRDWFVEIPIWIPGLRGQIAYGDFELVPPDEDDKREFERLMSDTGLEFYFVGLISVEFNRFWVQADAYSGKVSSVFSYISQTGSNEKELAIVKVQGTIPRLVSGYSVFEKSTEKDFKIALIPYLGFRYVSFHLQSDILDSTYVIDVRPDWFEPLIGLYIPIVYKRLKIDTQVDYGLTGTNNSWSISNRYRYRISKLVDVELGWNLITLNYYGVVNNQKLESRIQLFGPTAGIGFRF